MLVGFVLIAEQSQKYFLTAASCVIDTAGRNLWRGLTLSELRRILLLEHRWCVPTA